MLISKSTSTKITLFIIALSILVFIYWFGVMMKESSSIEKNRAVGNLSNDTNIIQSDEGDEGDEGVAVNSLPVAITELITNTNSSFSKPITNNTDSKKTDAVNREKNISTTNEEVPIFTEDKPIGYSLTEQDWVSLREQGLEAQLYILPEGGDGNKSIELERYLQEWVDSINSNYQYLYEVEEDARRLSERLSKFEEALTIKEQESLRLQGEAAERLLVPTE